MQKIWSKTLIPGEKWSGNIGRGKYIHFKTLGDNANVSMLMYNMRDVSERYNMPDTLKAQFTAYLSQGNVLMSDNGRVMASIVQDSVGWHDSLSGYTTRKMTDALPSIRGTAKKIMRHISSIKVLGFAAVKKTLKWNL